MAENDVISIDQKKQCQTVGNFTYVYLTIKKKSQIDKKDVKKILWQPKKFQKCQKKRVRTFQDNVTNSDQSL